METDIINELKERNLLTITDSAEDICNDLGIKSVQSDWDETDSTSLAYIKNKPVRPDLPKATTETLGCVKIGEGISVDGDGTISAQGGGEQVQSDWDVTDSSSAAFIKNKPTIPSEYILPTASSDTLGGVKIGSGISIDGNGVISASGGGGVKNFEGWAASSGNYNIFETGEDSDWSIANTALNSGKSVIMSFSDSGSQSVCVIGKYDEYVDGEFMWRLYGFNKEGQMVIWKDTGNY